MIQNKLNSNPIICEYFITMLEQLLMRCTLGAKEYNNLFCLRRKDP